MEAREFLCRYNEIKSKIEGKREELKQLESVVYCITPQSNGERVQSSGNLDKMGTAVVEYIRFKDKLNEQLVEYFREMRKIIAVVEQLKEPYYSVIHGQYIKNKSFADIAVEKHFSYQYTTELHRKALKKIQKIINNQSNLVETNNENML